MEEAISRKEAELEHLKNDLLALRGKIPDHISKSFSPLTKNAEDLEAFLSIGKLISTPRPQAARTFQPAQPASLASDWAAFEKLIEKEERSDSDLHETGPIDKHQWSYDPEEETLIGDGDMKNPTAVRCKSCLKLLAPSAFQAHFEKCKDYSERKLREEQERRAQNLIELNKKKRKRLIDDVPPASSQRKPKQPHIVVEAEDTYIHTEIGRLTSLLFFDTVAINGPPSQETISKVFSTIADNNPKPLNRLHHPSFLFPFVKPTPPSVLEAKQPIKFKNPHNKHSSHPIVVIEEDNGNSNQNEADSQHIVVETQNTSQ